MTRRTMVPSSGNLLVDERAGASDAVAAADHGAVVEDSINICGRIDRLPITRFLVLFLVTMGSGFFFDFFDLSAISTVVPVLIGQWGLSSDQVSWLIASGYIGMIFGSLPAGWLSDRIGRKRLFTITLAIVLVGQVLQGFAQSYGALLAFHAIVGIGVGGDVPIIWSYISEMLPARVRGRWSGFAFVIGVASIPAVALVASRIVPQSPDGWRYLFWIGAAVAVVFLPIRALITESPRHLLVNGRVDAADTAMRHIEERVEGEYGRPLPKPEPAATHVLAARAHWRELFASDLRRRTVFISIQTAATQAAFYGVTAFLPLLLISKGFTIVRSLEFTWITGLGIIAGPAIGFLIWDRFERRYTLMAAMAASAGIAIAFAYVRSEALVLIVGFLLFMVQQIAPLFVFTPEVFPTRVRGTGAGLANAVGRVVTAISILVIGSAISGITGQLVYVAAMFAVAVVALALLGVNTSRKRLEDVAI